MGLDSKYLNILPPSLNDLEAFVAIAGEGGLTAAGQTISQKPSTLRMAMQRISTTIGGEPFRRMKGGLELSRVGKDFLPEAKSILNQWYLVRDRLNGRSHKMAGSFRLCCIPEAGIVVLPSVFQYLERTYPEITISVVGPELRTISETVAGGAADFGLTVEKHSIAGMIKKNVFNTAISIWHNKQVKNIPRRLFVDPAFNDFEDIRKKISQKFSGDIIRVDSLSLIGELAGQGCGFGLLPDVVAKRLPKLSIASQHRHIGELSKIFLIYRPDLEHLAASQAVVEAFTAVAT